MARRVTGFLMLAVTVGSSCGAGVMMIRQGDIAWGLAFILLPFVMLFVCWNDNRVWRKTHSHKR